MNLGGDIEIEKKALEQTVLLIALTPIPKP